jgi:hypothetical protein
VLFFCLEKRWRYCVFLKKDADFFTYFFNFKSNLCLNDGIKINFSFVKMLTAVLMLYQNEQFHYWLILSVS